MVESKSETAASVDYGDHKLIVYASYRERDLLAISFCRAAIKRKDYLVLLSSTPQNFYHLFSKKPIFLKALKNGDMVLSEKREVLHSTQESFSRFFEGIIAESQRRRSHLAFLGITPVPTYGNFEVQLVIEKIIMKDSYRAGIAVLCLYYNQGLASLDLPDFLSLHKIHNSIFLNETVLTGHSKA